MTDNEVARQDEVLAALTRILRREATESAIVSTRSRVPTLCADGKVRYAERTETRVVEIPPKISDVNRAADLLGRRCGLWSERTEAAGSDVRIVDDVGAAGPEDGAAAECGRAGKRGGRAEDGAAECGGAGKRGSRAEDGAAAECGGAGKRGSRGEDGAAAECGGAGKRGGRAEDSAAECGEDGAAAECGGAGKRGSRGEDGAAEHGGAGKRGGRAEDGAAECGGAGRSAGKGKARRALNIRPAEIHTKSIPENGGAV